MSDVAQRVFAPGLLALAEEMTLSHETVQRLDRMYWTMRGHKPTTLAEWLPLWEAIKKHFVDTEAVTP